MSTGEAEGRVGMRLLTSELRLVLTRRRNIAGLMILAAVPILIGIVVRFAGVGDGAGPPFTSLVAGSGLFLVLTTWVMQMSVFLPMAMCILAGDAIAGEAHTGTLRYLLAVPVGRTRLLVIKFASLLIAAPAGVFMVGLVAAATGVTLFGVGDMVTLSGGRLPSGEASARLLLVGGYISVSLMAVCALGLFASTLTEQPIGAAVGTFMWVLIDQILGGFSALEWLHPFLLSHYWNDWAGLLREPVDWAGAGVGLVAPAVYIAVFVTAAWARFTTTDVTS